MITDDPLTSICDRLLLNKYEKDLQVNELLKAEKSLLDLRNTLKLQNDTLNELKANELVLSNEIEKHERMKWEGQNLKLKTEGEQNPTKLRKQNGIVNGYSIGTSAGMTKESESKIDFEELTMPDLKNKTIISICYRDNDIFLGTSDGVLIKFRYGITSILCSPGGVGGIGQLFPKNCNKSPVIVGLIDGKILVYPYTSKKEYFLDLPPIGKICYDLGVMYLTYVNGEMAIIDKANFEVDNKTLRNFSNIHYYQRIFNEAYVAIISHKDTKLYKVKSYRFDLEIIPGVSDVEGIVRLGHKKHICYSNHTMWVLDAECHIVEFLGFDAGIKFVKCDTLLVVADHNNWIYLFTRKHTGHLTRVCMKKMEGSISSIAIWHLKQSVQIAASVGDRVFIATFKFKS